MTVISQGEMKFIYAQLVIGIVLAVFWGLYIQAPIIIPDASPTTTSTDWLANLIPIPAEFVPLALVTTIFISPFIAFDVFIGLRAIKDFLSL